MKKSMFFGSFILLAFIPAYLYAQEVQIPTIEIRGSQDKVPAIVKEAILKDFGEGHKPMVWVTNNTIFRRGDLEEITGTDNKVEQSYLIYIETSTGSTLNAHYSLDGKLLSSKEYIKNFKPANKIMMALQNSEYKDWGIKKNFHIIKASSKGVENERYSLIMKKGKQKRTVYVKENGADKATVYGDSNDLLKLEKQVEIADVNW